jgi:hypothetical protein
MELARGSRGQFHRLDAYFASFTAHFEPFSITFHTAIFSRMCSAGNSISSETGYSLQLILGIGALETLSHDFAGYSKLRKYK